MVIKRMLQSMLVIALLSFSTGLFAQSNADRAAIVQKCIDLQELQQYVPSNESQVYIMQYPMTFEADMAVAKYNKKPIYLSRPEMYAKGVKSYFVFQTINAKGNTAEAEFQYYATINTTKVITVVASLTKSGENWKVVSTKIGGNK